MDAAVPVIQLQPGSGISGLSFGATRAAVRKFFGVPQSSEQSLIGCEVDSWSGVTAYFSNDDRLRALEVGPSRDCMLDGTMISALCFEQVIASLLAQGQDVLAGPDGTHFPNLSMTVCRSGPTPGGGVSFVLDRAGSGDWWEEPQLP